MRHRCRPKPADRVQDAAKAFIEDQVEGIRIDIVAFAGFAELVVPPTTDLDLLIETLENFSTSIGTVIGNVTLKSIDAISAVNPDVLPSGVDLSQEIDAIPSEPAKCSHFMIYWQLIILDES